MSQNSRNNRKRRIEAQLQAQLAANNAPSLPPDIDLLTLGHTKAGYLYIQPIPIKPSPLPDNYIVTITLGMEDDGHQFESDFNLAAFDGTLCLKCPNCEHFKPRLFFVNRGSWRWVCGNCKKLHVTYAVGQPPNPTLHDTRWTRPEDARWWENIVKQRKLISDRKWIAEQRAIAEQNNDQNRITFLNALAEKVDAYAK